jgi:hypothetical protein
MEDNYMEQIQEFLKNNNIQSDSNENISLNKNQLLECFKMLQNSKNQSIIKPNNNIINETKDNNVNSHLQYNELEKKIIVFLQIKELIILMIFLYMCKIIKIISLIKSKI